MRFKGSKSATRLAESHVGNISPASYDASRRATTAAAGQDIWEALRSLFHSAYSWAYSCIAWVWT